MSSGCVRDSRYIVALLNSTLFVFLYRLLALEEGRVLAQVKPTLVEEIPIRVIPDSGGERAAHNRLLELVDQLELLCDRLQNVNSEHERTALWRQVDNDNEEIDGIVFALYRLSADEISLIQGNPLTLATAT